MPVLKRMRLKQDLGGLPDKIMKNRILLTLATLVLLSLAYFIGNAGSYVQAKSADPVSQCELVATTGKIDIFFCDPGNGITPFLQNSYGFMRDAEQ